MKKIYTSARELIGNTPLVELTHIEKTEKLTARLLAKVESFNPGGSVKDRAALSMLQNAIQKGLLAEGTVIIEPTSGNTGIGLCAAAATMGYACVIVMPENMSQERQRIMAAFGAQVVLSPASEGMTGAIALAKKIAAKYEKSFIPNQFENPANPAAHFTTTGPEIWDDTDGAVDIFVAGAGTGGTVTGVGRYLKQKNPSIQIIAVEPSDSAVISGKQPGKHKLQGIGAGFLPEILDLSVIDRVIPVTSEDAYAAARRIGPEEGLLVGISSGAALHAAIALAKEPANTGKTIVVLFPDSGERYLSTDLYE